MVSSNNPYTFDYHMLQIAKGKERKPVVVRPNTSAWLSEDGLSFDVMVYGNRVCTLYADGSVRVSASTGSSMTTKNRINDALIPLGWKITGSPKGGWVVRTTEAPVRSMEYVRDMILTSVKKKEA